MMNRIVRKLVIVILCSIILLPSIRIHAATKYYEAELNGKKSSQYTGSVYKIRLKNNKLIIYGTFKVYPTKKDWKNRYKSGKYTMLEFKKRTFKLSKNIRFYDSQETGRFRRSQRYFIKTAKKLNGLVLSIKVKNGMIETATFFS